MQTTITLSTHTFQFIYQSMPTHFCVHTLSINSLLQSLMQPTFIISRDMLNQFTHSNLLKTSTFHIDSIPIIYASLASVTSLQNLVVEC